MVFTYPLEWPATHPRTVTPRRSQFGNNWTLYGVSNDLEYELRLLGAKNVVVTTNAVVSAKGLPYSSQRKIEDAGVAVYFELNGAQRCFPCDRWDRIEHNLRAITLSVGALRGLDRWGSKHMVDAAFEGFKALPPPSTNPYHGLSVSELKAKLREHHPDTGDGDTQSFENALSALRSLTSEAQR